MTTNWEDWEREVLEEAARVSGSGDRQHKAKSSWRDGTYTAAQLQHEVFPEVSFCVPGLIPEGLTIIAGRPKIGKSWLALDICMAVSAGRFCLGDRQPIQGDVLYVAMEDNRKRMQRRIDRLLSPFNASWPKSLTIAHSWRRLDKGGVDDIRAWIEQASNPRLVVLDTLAGVKPIKTREGYTEDYESLAELHRLTSEKQTSISVLTHTRKMEAEDPIDLVSGTLGLAGCADTVLVLNRTAQGTTLYLRGRDIEEAEHAIHFDRIGCRWSILGDASEVHLSNERGKILLLLEKADELLTPNNIAIGANMVPNNVWRLLGKMVEDGQVLKADRGHYYHPNRPDLAPPGKVGTDGKEGQTMPSGSKGKAKG